MLRDRPSENLVELFVQRCRRSASTVIRGATACLFAIEPEGLADTLGRLLSSDDEADAETVRRIVMEAPPSSTLEALYWELAADGSPQQRLLIIDHLAAADFNRNSLDHWHALAGDDDDDVREAALAVIAKSAADDSLQLLIASLLANTLALASPLFVIQVLNRYVAHGVDATLVTSPIERANNAVFSTIGVRISR